MGARNKGLSRSSIGPIVTTSRICWGKITKKVRAKGSQRNDLGEWVKCFTFASKAKTGDLITK